MSPSGPHVTLEITRYLQALADDARAIAPDDDLFDTGVVRSMNVLALINHLEDTYGVAVAPRDVFAGRLRSVRALVALVDERAGAVAVGKVA